MTTLLAGHPAILSLGLTVAGTRVVALFSVVEAMRTASNGRLDYRLCFCSSC
jgi:hypothetical protein